MGTKKLPIFKTYFYDVTFFEKKKNTTIFLNKYKSKFYWEEISTFFKRIILGLKNK